MTDRMPLREEKKTSKNKKKKAARRVYVEPSYPTKLAVASFAWALVGWALAALAPHLAYLPGVELLHLLLPAITVGFLGLNLYFAVRDLWRQVHPLRLLVVTGVQVALFTTLFFQLSAHIGADLYDTDGPTSAWQWIRFSLGHALRASDVLDVVEAYSLKVQPIKHTSNLVAVFVILYHLVVDVFVLGVLWEIVAKIRRDVLADEGIRWLLKLTFGIVFAVWFFAWVAVAFFLYPWSSIDIPLWFVDNILHVVDFADIMESFDIRLHSVPREGLNGTLTFFCRIWVSVLVAGVIALIRTRKKQAPERRIATPPEANWSAFWGKQMAVLAGGACAVLVTGFAFQVVVGDPAPALASAVSGDSASKTQAALAALRRLGPAASDTAPTLVAARGKIADAATRDEVTRTLGHLGMKAADDLAAIATKEAGPPAVIAVQALGSLGEEAAAHLASVWATTNGDVRAAADAGLQRLGADALPALMAATTADNAEAHFHWFKELDRNWRVRLTNNPTVLAIQQLPDALARLQGNPSPEQVTAALDTLRRAGTAARSAAPGIVDLLGHKDHNVQAAATKVLVSFGPQFTPALLRKLEDLKLPAPLGAGIVAVLADESMWDATTLSDPAHVPILIKLIRPQTNINGVSSAASRPIALRGLTAAGPAAKAAVPDLIELVIDPDEPTRQAVRKALDKIDPDWKKHTKLVRGLADFFLPLQALPREEREELLAAMGDLDPADGKRFAEAVSKAMYSPPGKARPQYDQDERPGDSREERTARRKREEAERVAAYRDGILTALEQVGPRIKAAGPELVRPLILWAHEGGEPMKRAMGLVARLEVDIGPQVPEYVRFLGLKEGGTAFVKAVGPTAAVPGLARLLPAGGNGKVDWLARMFAVRLLTEFGPAARPALPQLIEQLASPDGHMRLEGTPIYREMIFKCLTAADPGWSKHPDVPATLVALTGKLQGSDGMTPEARKQFIFMLAEIDPDAARAAVPGVVKQLLARHGQGFEPGGDAPAIELLDKLSPKWREEAAKPVVDEMIKYGAVSDRRSGSIIRYLGAAAVPHLTAAVAGANVDAGDRNNQRSARFAALAFLKQLGSLGRPALPTVLHVFSAKDLRTDDAGPILATLAALDPEWATSAEGKPALAKLLPDLLAGGNSWYVTACRAAGPAVLPEVLKHLAAAKKPESRQLTLAAIRDLGPDVRKAAQPTIEKALKDPEPPVRASAYEALGKLCKGDKTAVGLLAPGLADGGHNVGMQAQYALDAADPSWRTNPGLKPTMEVLFKGLSSADGNRRIGTLLLLETLIPAEGIAPAIERMLKTEKDSNVRMAAQHVLKAARSRQK